MTWVALHEVTHAVQFAGVPWLQGHLAALVRELLEGAELRLDNPRRLRVPSGDEVKRVLSALRHGDLSRSSQVPPSARRSSESRR